MKGNNIHIDYKYLKKYIYRKTSLFRYLYLSCFDFILWLIKIAVSFLFPYLMVIIVTIIMVALKIEQKFDDNLAWGLTSGALGLLGITASALALVRGINKEYFRINALKIFGTYKLFGLYNYYFIWIGSVLFAIGSLISSITKDKSVYPCALTSIMYTVFVVITYIYIFFKNDKNKYIKYLKNSGALKIKRRSSKMNQNVFFCYKHPKAKRFFSNLWIITSSGQYNLHNRIKEYFNNYYFSRDGNLTNNVRLLKIYFEEISKYISTDIDLFLLTDLIESVNEKLIENLKKEREYAIIKDILESMLVLSTKILTSKYFLDEIDMKNVVYSKEIKEPKNEKYNHMLTEYTTSIKIHVDLFCKLFDKVVESFELVRTIKANDKYINDIKKNVLPLFQEYKKEFQKNIKTPI